MSAIDKLTSASRYVHSLEKHIVLDTQLNNDKEEKPTKASNTRNQTGI